MKAFGTSVLTLVFLTLSACANISDPAQRQAFADDYRYRCELSTGIDRLACLDQLKYRTQS
jgi:hypothetical protein